MMKSNFILENVSKYFANHKHSVIFIQQITNKTTNNNININDNNNNNNNNKRLMSLRQIERFIKIMHLIPKRDFVGAVESPQAISKKFRYSQSQFTKKYFDIYRRCNPGFDQKDSVRLHPEVEFSTTLGQANFFKFFFENRLDQIITNLIDKLGGGGISKVFETYDPKKSNSKSNSKSNQNKKNKKIKKIKKIITLTKKRSRRFIIISFQDLTKLIDKPMIVKRLLFLVKKSQASVNGSAPQRIGIRGNR